jgi:hypothetical protein
MRTIVTFICSVLIFNISLSGQNYKTILVKARTKMTDYFPYNERYRYQDFRPGKVVFKNGSSNNINLNYYYLTGEIVFLQTKDTLYISKKKDILYVVAPDTFYYDNGYMEVISGGELKVGLKQYVKIKDVLKEGAMGTMNRVSSIDTYSSLWADGSSYGLVPNENIEVQMTLEYYLSKSSPEFIIFNKKNVIQLFPQKEDEIKAYIKSNKVDFDSRDDLLRFADYLRSL